MIYATTPYTPGSTVTITLSDDEPRNLLHILREYMELEGTFDVTAPALIDALENLGVR